MTAKNTQSVTLFNLRSAYVLILFLFCTTSMIAQTITDVYPTRVTEGVTVTIEGTGFTNATRNSIHVPGMSVEKRQLLSPTRMTFVISIAVAVS